MKLQLHGLRDAGCDIVFAENAKGEDLDRGGLEEALLACRAGDEFVVWRLDRLSRKQLHVGQVLDFLAASEVGFRIVSGIGSSIDASQREGRALLGVLASFGEYEWESIRARSSAGQRARRVGLWERIEDRHRTHFHNAGRTHLGTRRR